MMRLLAVLASAALGWIVGVVVTYLAFSVFQVPRISVYFVAPYVLAVAASVAPVSRKDAFLRIFTIVGASLFASFTMFRDQGTDFLAGLEYWAAIGVPIFGLLPALVGTFISKRMSVSR